MGILGSLLYPDDPKMAADLNAKQQKLQDENNLHNTLVNSYRLVGETTKTFDAYLMSLLAMHYYLTYTEEDLSNLPETDLPSITKSIADTIESAALDVLTAKMAVDGITAIKNGITNLVKQSGRFSRTAPEGDAAVSEGLGADVEATSLEAPMLRSGTVEVMTTESPEVAQEMSGELGELSSGVSEAVDSISEGSEIAEETSEVAEVAETGAGAAEAGAEAAEAGEAGAGFSAVLGPVLLVVVAVTEIMGAIKEGQTHAKLKDAETKMDGLMTKSEKALTDMKSAYTHLLNAAKADITAYNKLLPDLFAISQESGLNRQAFSTDGIKTFIDGMTSITITNDGTKGFEAAAMANLSDAKQFISNHAVSTSQTAEIVKQIKTHMEKNNLTDLPDGDAFLKSIAEADSIDLAIVANANVYRRNIATVAAMLEPYHTQVIDNTPPDAKVARPPKTAKTGAPNPNFTPKPSGFKIPVVKTG